MTENRTRQYTDDQYNRTPDHELGSGFSNYERLMVELNNRQYYPKEVYENFLNENGLDAYDTFDKNTDHAKLFETVYSILQTLLSNIDMYRRTETEFVTSGEAATSLRNRLKDLRAEINRIKAEMHYADFDFTFMYYTRGGDIMGFNLMYTPLETIFDATMEREGRNITAYTSGNEFQAFMRRNDDGNNYEDRITLYYYTNAPVVQGSLISYGNKIYILVNRETEENHCYHKSSALACNGMITLNNREVIGIPCYASVMKDGLAESNNMLSLINGTMEFITESNSLSRQIQIDDTFNEFGRTYKVNNIYYKDGILHVITEVNTNERPIEHLKIVIDGLSKDTYMVGDFFQMDQWHSKHTGLKKIFLKQVLLLYLVIRMYPIHIKS